MAEATYFASTKESAAGAAKRHLAVFNATGSGKAMKVYRVLAAGSPAMAVAGLVIPLTVGRITAVPTGGSAASVGKADNADANPPAQVTTSVGATGGATEEAACFGCGTISGEETSGGAYVPLYESKIDGTKQIVCPEGTGVLVKQGTLASAGNLTVVVFFTLV